MKTHEELKKGMECYTPRWVANHWKSCSSKCPYITLSASCRGQLVYDAIVYIQQLENHIGKLTKRWSSSKPYSLSESVLMRLQHESGYFDRESGERS